MSLYFFITEVLFAITFALIVMYIFYEVGKKSGLNSSSRKEMLEKKNKNKKRIIEIENY